MNCQDASRLLDAYVDGELDAGATAAMRAHVEACAACARLVDQRSALGRLLHAVPHYAAPDRLRAAVLTATRRRRARGRWTLVWATAAVIALAIAGAAAARFIGERRATAEIASAIVADHVEALRAQHLIEVVSSDQHTVKPWFLGKLDFSPPVEDLASAGFPLAGGRVDRLDGRTVAVLVYHRRLHPIAVFVWPESDAAESRTDSRTIRGFHVRHWIKDGMAFWAVSDVNSDEFATFVHILGG